MATERYFVGPTLLTDIRSTIARVQGMPTSESGGHQKGMFIPLTPPLGEGGNFFRTATFTGSWSIGSVKTVTLRNQTATPNTVSVTNLFFDYPPTTNSVNCGIAKEGTAWHLIDVPIKYDTASIFSAYTTATATVLTGQIQNASFVSGVSAVLDTVTCDIDVSVQTSGISYWGPANTTTISLVTAVGTSTQTVQYLRFAD